MTLAWGRRQLVAACCTAALIFNLALPQLGRTANAVAQTTAALTGQTPTIVLAGQARLLGPHQPDSDLTINVSLPLRNEPALATFIAADASHGVYLSQQQFDQTYGATAQQVQAVAQWAAAHGLSVTYTSGDNTLLTLQGTTAAVEAALGVTMNDYRRADGTVFFSNDRDATVPAALGITAISGLNNLPRFHTLHRSAAVALFRSGGYYPSDFRTAYDVAGHGYDGSGQTIGFTLWGTSVPNSDLSTFASQTGDVAMSAGTGPDQIEWIPENGGSSATDALVETALDVEYAHGIATHAHLKYFLGDETCSGGQCGGSDTGLEDAIAAAANDTSIHVVSNSWGGGEAPSTSDPFTSATESSFQHAVAVGTTFYFSSGDNGSDSGGTGLASYPADSPYVVSVGGTTLNTTGSYAYSSETAWNGSGGGCSAVFSRPSWQTGVGAATCSGRAEPDVAADADPNSGAYVYVQGSGQQIGGTSLAAPLFTGMAAVADAYAAANSRSRIGWAAPKIYSLANSSSYGTAFHDVTSGNNGYPAGPGWDEATGWGSIDWWPWTQAMVGTTQATATPTSTSTSVATATNTPIRPTATSTLVAATATNTPVPATATNTPVAPTATSTATSTCAGDGTCLTGFSASATSVAVNTNVTLSATTNIDVGPTQWYIDIVDETGSVLQSCSSGTSCTATVTSSTAASHTYTAWLSTSPSSITGGGPQSSSVTVTWTSTATATNTPAVTKTPAATKTPVATATNTPAGATSTRTSTPVPPTATNTSVAATGTPTHTPVPATATNTATHTPVPATATSTPSSGCTGSGVVNGGFETGNLNGWCTGGVGQGGQPIASTQQAHTGSYSGRLGVPSGNSEPNGDNCMYQNINVTGSHTLNFYDYEVHPSSGTDYDWQEAYWRPYGTTGCAETGTKLYKLNNSDEEYWYHDAFSVTGPGQIYFNVHEDGYGDVSAMYIDDLTLR